MKTKVCQLVKTIRKYITKLKQYIISYGLIGSVLGLLKLLIVLILAILGGGKFVEWLQSKTIRKYITKLKQYIISYGLIGSVLGLLKLLIMLILAILGGSKFVEWLQSLPKRPGQWLADKRSPSKSSMLERENADKLLEHFIKQWLENDNISQEDTLEWQNQKIVFCQWMQANYKIHLENQRKNKKKHFKTAHKRGLYQSISTGARKTVAMISGFLTFTVSSVFGLKEFWEYLSNRQAHKIPEWGVWPLFVLVVVVVVLVGLYIFQVLFQVEHTKQIDSIDRREETWLRHTEAIQNYQREMISYMTKSGKYGKYLAKSDNDRIFMDQIIDVWNKNGEKFLHNMTRTQNPNDDNKA